jgi:predicted transcriptional regulator
LTAAFRGTRPASKQEVPREGKAREAIEAGLAEQLQGLAGEAGVRHTL